MPGPDETQYERWSSPWFGACLLGVSFLAAGEIKAADTNDFLARVYTNSAKQVLSYRLLPPKDYDAQKSYPVILYLHGAAARGHDNAEPLNWGPMLFLDPALREKHRFFLLVPQCPSGAGWVQASLASGIGYKEGEPLSLALELTGKVLPREFNIDPKRRYVTGVSMGGHAVWVLLGRRPGFFAAAVPVCSFGEQNLVTDAGAKCPVWVFHSDDDHLAPVQEARSLVKAWHEHGGTAKYTEYTGLRHSSWKKAYIEPEMFDWLFGQELK